MKEEELSVQRIPAIALVAYNLQHQIHLRTDTMLRYIHEVIATLLQVAGFLPPVSLGCLQHQMHLRTDTMLP